MPSTTTTDETSGSSLSGHHQGGFGLETPVQAVSPNGGKVISRASSGPPELLSPEGKRLNTTSNNDCTESGHVVQRRTVQSKVGWGRE